MSLQFLISSFVTLLINYVLKRCPVIKGVELIQWRLSNVTVPRPPKLTHFSRVRDKGLGERSTVPPGALSSSPSLPRLAKIVPFPAQHQHHAAPPCPTLSHTECHCLPSDCPLTLHNATAMKSLFSLPTPLFSRGWHRLCIFIKWIWLGNVWREKGRGWGFVLAGGLAVTRACTKRKAWERVWRSGWNLRSWWFSQRACDG